METTTNNVEVKTKRKSRKFQENSIFIRISFIIGISTIILLGIYICTGGFLLQHGKLPLYLVSSFFIVLTFVGITFGCLSFRQGKNIYGILGFSFNFIAMGLHILILILIITAGFPP